MRKMTFGLFLLLFTILIMLLSTAGPELFVRYRDKVILGQIYTRAMESDGGGYRCTLSPDEKLYILSKSPGRQMLPESEQYAFTRDSGYDDLDGTYAFVLSHKSPSRKEITDYQIYETCNQGLVALKELGILSDMVRNVGSGACDAALYSTIDVLEPRNSVAVWELELADVQKNMDREDRLMGAHIDADNGKVYEFYARTPLTWENMGPGRIAGDWAEYMGLEAPTPYETDNPLMEATPYFSKYACGGVGDQKTIVTIGFYEEVNELFLKISGWCNFDAKMMVF